jgi:tail tube protein
MAGALDHQIGLIPESTYGTPLTPTTFLEWDMDNSGHSWDPKVVQGTGMQVGDGGFQRADRSVSVLGQGKGTVGLDYQDRSMGKFIDSFAGNGAATLVAGTTYQHVFTSALTGALLPSRTLEYGIVRSDAGGTVDAFRYAGVTFPKLTVSCDTSDVLKAVGEWDARSFIRNTSPATASYAAGMLTPFHFGHAAVTFGGTLVLPTTVALGSGGTAVTNFRNFTWEMDNQADVDDWALGGVRNQPRIGQRASSLKMTARYDVATYDDALAAHTTVPITITFTDTSKVISGALNPVVQFVFPSCKLTAGDRPGPSVDTPVNELEFRVLKPTTGNAWYIVHRTSDATV